MLRKIIERQGNLLFGTANVERFKERWAELPPDSISGLRYAVSIAFPLSKKVLLSIEDAPTRLYAYHYKQINYFLDRTGLIVSGFIQSKGYNALPIPASQTIDHAKQKGHISHKDIAEAAGLGWRGRNNLIVTPKYGAAVRLVSVLTDMPLSQGRPLKKNCGKCIKCVAVCPAHSIKSDPAEFDKDGCYKKLCEFRKIPGIGHHICGICVKACMGGENG